MGAPAKGRVTLRQDLVQRLILAASQEKVNYQVLLERAVTEYLANGVKDWAAVHAKISSLERERDTDRALRCRVALFLASSHVDGCGCAFCILARELDPHLPSQKVRCARGQTMT